MAFGIYGLVGFATKSKFFEVRRNSRVMALLITAGDRAGRSAGQAFRQIRR